MYLADADLYGKNYQAIQKDVKTNSNDIGKYEAPSSLKSILSNDTYSKNWNGRSKGTM